VADRTRFDTLCDETPKTGSETILTVGERNAPLLLARELDAGSVLMFTISADRSWSNFPIHPLYAMLLPQAVTNMASRPETRQRIVGGVAELPVQGRKAGDRARVKTPNVEDGDAIEAKVTRSGKLPVCAIDAQQVGFYKVEAEGEAPSVEMAANVDAAESNVQVVTADLLTTTLEPEGVRVIAASEELAGEIKNSRRGRELARLLLICGVCVFVLQGLLAKYFTNRMSNPETDVSASLQMSRVSAARRS
jgi:hypothetical protein